MAETPAAAAPVRLYRCQRGHSFESAQPFTISFGMGDTVVRTDALCPECIVQVLNEEVATLEVTDGEARP